MLVRACIGRFRGQFKILLVNLKKETLGRPRSRWKENIRIYLQAIGVNMRNVR